MKIIEREIASRTITTPMNKTAKYCQASFNSDGNITLRSYDIRNKDSDEIIILSAEETQAIFKLLQEMSRNASGLPF